jgi:hypothetical protein
MRDSQGFDITGSNLKHDFKKPHIQRIKGIIRNNITIVDEELIAFSCHGDL